MKTIVKRIFICLFLFSLMSLNKKDLYDSMSSTKENVIQAKINYLSKQSSSDARAFKAIFTMISAQFYYAPWNKFNTFNEGKNALEKEIKANKSNVEFRFLRLMIQENAPAIVMYSNNIEEDAKMIKKSLNNLDVETQLFIKKYAKKSENLVSLK